MQPPRFTVSTGLSSSSLQLLFILLLLAGSLSTVPTVASTDELPTNNAASGPDVFSEIDAASLTKSQNNSESFDMRHSSVDIAEAAVDPENDTSAQSSSTADKTSTEYITQAMTTPSSTTLISPSPAVSVVTSFTASVPTDNESSSLSTSTSSISMSSITTITTIMPITNQVVDQSTISTTEIETDSTESITAKAFTEESGGMPTGIVALVTMITFAMVVVIGYVSLIVWRRYLEYRYGNRELLVNDLEFDTNDLRHFEL